jgi:hypothetical protein
LSEFTGKFEQGESRLAAETVPKNKIKFSTVKRLSDVKGFVWYTPAILYLWGRFWDLQWSDLLLKHSVKLLWHKFDKPIFKGLVAESDEWNYTLWAAKEDEWDTICDFILSSCVMDAESKTLIQYGLQTFSVVDPLLQDKSGIVSQSSSSVLINAFAVASNYYQVAFSPTEKFYDMPQVRTFKPMAKQKLLALKMFDKREDPISVFKERFDVDE